MFPVVERNTAKDFHLTRRTRRASFLQLQHIIPTTTHLIPAISRDSQQPSKTIKCPTCMPFNPLNPHHQKTTRLYNAHQISSLVASTMTGQLIPPDIGRSQKTRKVRSGPLGNHTTTLWSDIESNHTQADHTLTAHFRGRKLRGRRVALPAGYQGTKRFSEICIA